MGSDDAPTPTPRESGTLQRAPVFEGLARGCAEILEKAVRDTLDAAKSKEKVLWILDLGRARELREQAKTLSVVAMRARELERFFASWQEKDPGPAARLEAVLALRTCEGVAKPYTPRA